MPEEPAWFYKLDELVYQGYRHGMAVSLLALDYMRVNSSETFSFATDREFWEEGKSKAEIDFFCVPDGVLTIGEAKKEGRLGSSVSEENAEISKYLRVARSLSARQVVFATMSEVWSDSTINRVVAAFGDTKWVRVRFLNRKQLFEPKSR
jgi:hypothetical protein